MGLIQTARFNAFGPSNSLGYHGIAVKSGHMCRGQKLDCIAWGMIIHQLVGVIYPLEGIPHDGGMTRTYTVPCVDHCSYILIETSWLGPLYNARKLSFLLDMELFCPHIGWFHFPKKSGVNGGRCICVGSHGPSIRLNAPEVPMCCVPK